MIVAPLLLIALAGGYAVLVMSQHQQSPLDALGRWLGSFILLVALTGLVCTAVCALRCRYGGACGAAPRMTCPVLSLPAAPR